MLLAIDAGNTNTVFALIDGDRLVQEWRISTKDQRTEDEYMVWVNQLLTLHDLDRAIITSAIIASVVPQVVRPLTLLCRRFFNCEPLLVGSESVDLGIEVRLSNPREVGADRLVNAVAAYDQYGGNLAIIDFGTATTFDVVAQDGGYEGGVICPGINLSLAALHQAAAKLPKIAIEPPKSEKATGKSTFEAMQSGIFWGYIGMIEGLVARLRAEHGSDMQTVATGGLAPIFAGQTDAIQHVQGDLTLKGLALIHARQSLSA